MSKLLQTLTLASITCFAFSSATIAQDKSGDKLGEYDEIVIKRNTNKDGKVTIEIKDGNVLVDGEKMDAYKEGDISVYRRRIRPVDGNTFNFAMPPGGGGIQLFNEDDETGDDEPAAALAHEVDVRMLEELHHMQAGHRVAADQPVHDEPVESQIAE